MKNSEESAKNPMQDLQDAYRAGWLSAHEQFEQNIYDYVGSPVYLKEMAIALTKFV